MNTFAELIANFFTHKDHLPPGNQIAGSLFTPLHLVFAAVCLFMVIFFSFRVAKKRENTIKIVFGILWAVLLVLEIAKILWETISGNTVQFEWGGILPLYPCSIFLYAMPFAIWGNGLVRRSACGYVCSLGLLGGAINFIYPANILSNYSCLSFAGFHTFLYHGALVFCALTMLLSGYYSYRVTKWWELLLPAGPCLAVSVIANLVNFSPIGSDYMFFKLNSFFFAPLGQATADWVSVLIVYAAYLLIHALPHLPFFIANQRKNA